MNNFIPSLITIAITLIIIWSWVGIEKLIEWRELKQLERDLSKHRKRPL